MSLARHGKVSGVDSIFYPDRHLRNVSKYFTLQNRSELLLFGARRFQDVVVYDEVFLTRFRRRFERNSNELRRHYLKYIVEASEGSE